MKKKINFLVTFMLVSVLFFGSSINTYAFSPNSDKELQYIDEGYTEEGIHYYVYKCVYKEAVPEIEESAFKNTSRVVVAKFIEDYLIIYQGYIVPPSSFIYDQYDNDFKVQMKGSLSIKSYIHNNYPITAGCTIASYSGHIYGNQ